jgi:hypothetical protein
MLPSLGLVCKCGVLTMQWNPAQLLSLLQPSSLPSSQANVLPPLQPTFTKTTSGYCTGTFIAVNLAHTFLNVVSHTVTHFLFGFKGFAVGC